MTMKFQTSRSATVDTETVTVTAAITAAEPIPWSHSKGRTWVPETARTAFTRTRHGQPHYPGTWSDWGMGTVTVIGRRVKASGELGAERDEQLYGYRSDAGTPLGQIYDHMKSLRPVGDSLPVALPVAEVTDLDA
jgi:hypothetical protein